MKYVYSHVPANKGKFEPVKRIFMGNIKNKKKSFTKVESVINKAIDFTRLRQICDVASIDSLSVYEDYFNCACLTSVDVERSFSKYKNIFSSRRHCLPRQIWKNT